MSGHVNFSALERIVVFLKNRYLDGFKEPASLEEILSQIENAADISRNHREWLVREALVNNVRIRPFKSEDGSAKYSFKPIIELKDDTIAAFRNYLKERYEAGHGATSMDDIVDSIPRAGEKVKKMLKKDLIIVITRASDKKKFIFFNDVQPKDNIGIDEEFIKLWRSVSVDGFADEKIEEYLEKQGISSIKDLVSKKLEPIQKRRKVVRRQNKNFKAHNEHMKDILEDYSETNK